MCEALGPVPSTQNEGSREKEGRKGGKGEGREGGREGQRVEGRQALVHMCYKCYTQNK